MASRRDRPTLGVLSIILFIIITYLSARVSSGLDPAQAHQAKLFAAVLCAFNIAILFGWIGFGRLGGIIFTILSFIIGLWSVLRANIYGYYPLTLSFFFTSFLGYFYSLTEGKAVQSYGLKMEKADEDINIIANNIEEKKKAIKSLEEKLERYSVLKGVVEEFSAALSIDDINKLIIEKAFSTLGKTGRVLLFLVDTEKQELILSASKGDLRGKAKKGDIFDKWVLRHRKSLIIEDITRDFRFTADDVEDAKRSFKSLIAAPLVSEDKVVGVLRMDSPEEFMYTQDDLRLLDIISGLGAVSIQNAALYSRTQELAIKDGLTGLFVRRYFMERFQAEIKRAALSKGTFSLAIFDIDHFKEYNDRYGHTAGDLVLKHLSRIMFSMTREVDILARYGGEEMVLLLIGMDKSSALKEAEMIRKLIEERPLMLRRKESRVTVSVGVSNYPKDAVTDEELIRIADERLYKAKAKGRNRVCAN